MLNKKLEKALNEQLNMELQSAYIYQSMAAYFEGANFKGFAKWMDLQATEEQEHARKIYDYIFSKGGTVTLTAIDAPKSSWKNAEEVFKDSLGHEQAVTKSIDKIYALARKENDYATEIFLQWFITEQIEEEENVTEIIDKIKLLGVSITTSMYLLDKELGTRA